MKSCTKKGSCFPKFDISSCVKSITGSVLYSFLVRGYGRLMQNGWTNYNLHVSHLMDHDIGVALNMWPQNMLNIND